MIIISLLALYLTIINIYFYNKQKKKSLGLKRWSQYFYCLFNLFFFIGFFLFFLRILTFFRETKSLNLGTLLFNFNLFNLVIFLFFFISLKRLLFFFFKTSFFKLHYFYLAPENNSYCEIYYNFYIFGIHKNCRKIYIYFFWFDKIMLLFLVLFFVNDIIFNKLILDYSLYFLKYYGFFKVFYILINFVSQKQNLELDYYIFNLYYMDGVSLDEGFFAETLSKRYFEVKQYEKNIINI